VTDVAVPHVLTTPGGSITFNDGSADQFYLNAIPGLDTIPARVPIDKIAFGHGARAHPSWRDAKHFAPEGSLLITSTRVMDDIVTIRNTMAAQLATVVDALIGDTSGTWQTTPLGQASRTWTVVRDAEGIQWTHVDNYQVLDFVFFLVAPDPVPV
jgi:hypothetical protein